jgi:hypothetical protein
MEIKPEPRRYCSVDDFLEVARNYQDEKDRTLYLNAHVVELWYLTRSGNLTTCKIVRVNTSLLSRDEAWTFLERLDKIIPREEWIPDTEEEWQG